MRTHLLTSSLICGLTTFASAQTKYATSPAGFLTTEGARYASSNPINPYMASRNFGAYPEYRSQIMDSTHVGAGLRMIIGLDYRLDNPRSFTAAEARTWSKVTLHMGEGDYTKSTTNFSTNFSSTPTQVFSGSVTWKAVTSAPTSTPAPWGAVSFTFTALWPQFNVTGTIMDYNFTGGTLASNAKWDQDTISRYALDAAWINVLQSGYQNPYSAGAGCTDSGQTKFATDYIYLQTYSKDAFTNANSFRMDRGIWDGPKSSPNFVFLSTGRANPPIPFPGVTCNGIAINLAQVFWTETVTTNTTGYWRQIRNYPYVPVVPGIRVHFQSAWSDTVTKQVMLGRPNGSELSVQPPGKMATVTKIGTKATTRKQEIQETPLTRYNY